MPFELHLDGVAQPQIDTSSGAMKGQPFGDQFVDP
jgi:hypothetical protein